MTKLKGIQYNSWRMQQRAGFKRHVNYFSPCFSLISLRAKILIEQKREAKARKEMEEMKRKEKERIELGKNLNKLRELKAEQEQKEVMEGWKKEKEEAKAARERVKQQIAQDRSVTSALVNIMVPWLGNMLG